MIKAAWLIAIIAMNYLIVHAQPNVKLTSNSTDRWMEIVPINATKTMNIEQMRLITTEKAIFGLGENDVLVEMPQRKTTDALGHDHYYFQQFFKNVAVEGAVFALHRTPTNKWLANGFIAKNLELAITPNLSENQALQSALQFVNGQQYAWQDPTFEAALKDGETDPNLTFYPKGELVIVSPDLGKPNTQVDSYRLAYKFDIYAVQPLKRAYVYVDANTGNVITENNRICTADTPCTGDASYACSNPVNITCEHAGSNYRMRQSSSGSGIRTFNADNTWSYLLFDIIDMDTHFNNDPTAVAAHWGTEQTYAYYLSEHNQNSFDNNGALIRSWVHYGVNYNNAFWNGNWMTYGDGDGTTFTALVSIDVVGHEITHGVTNFSADLVYAYEPGALNESFSDIFGTAIEFYADPVCSDWLIGEDITVVTGKNCLRNMGNPNSASALTQQPDTYLGDFWYTGSGDNGGVHYNSGVQNFWFYLLSEGGSGMNDNGDAYTISGIGIDKAAAIAYRNLTTYLFPTAQYADARAGAVQAAIDLYGAGSNEAIQTEAAWCAVGVGTCTPNTNSLTLTSPNGGEVWAYNNPAQQAIIWSSTGTIANVKLQYSINGGATWITIANSTTNDGFYNWVIPNVTSAIALVRIQDVNDGTVNDESDGYFSLEGCNVVAGFTASAMEVCEGDNIIFTNTSSTFPLTYQWQIGGSTQSTNEDYTHTFNSAGNIVVTLIADNGQGCTDSFSEVITVLANPTADFSYTTNGLEADFMATYSGASAYEWTIDGGIISSAASFNHTFLAEGTYTVCLDVETVDCGSVFGCESVGILDTEPCVDGDESWIQYTDGEDITVLVEDGNYLWVGTTGGLVQLDKTTGNTAFFNNANSDLPRNHIRALELDSSGNLWVGTSGGGVAKFDGLNWIIYDNSNSFLPDNSIRSLFEDSNGDIWIGMYSGGVAKYNHVYWTIYNTSTSGLPYPTVKAIMERNGVMWFGTYGGGVATFDGVNWTVYDEDNSMLPANRVNTLLDDGVGNVWIGCDNSGLAKFDGTSWTVYTSSNSGLPSNQVDDLLLDSNNNIWIGAWYGITVFDGVNWTVYNSSNSNLVSSRAASLLLDNSNSIWAGLTYSGGLWKFNDVDDWIFHPTSNSDLNDGFIGFLKEDKSGNVWIKNLFGLLEFDGTSWIEHNYTTVGNTLSVTSAMAVDDAGNLWVDIIPGLSKFNGTYWLEYTSVNSNIPDVNTSVIFADNSDIWLGTSGDGLVFFDGVDFITYNTSNSGLSNDYIQDISKGNNNILWIGTQEGLISFDGADWVTYDTNNSDLPNNYVKAVCVDEFDNVWAGVGGSLVKFDGLDWTIYNMSNSNLPSDVILDLEIDNFGNIWLGLGSSQGIAKFDGVIWTHYSISNSGIPDYHGQELVARANGDIWVGTNNGIGVLTTSNLVTASFQAPTSPICTNTVSTFTNTSTGAATYEWQVNGTTISTDIDLTYTFTIADDYMVTLIATSGACTDFYQELITVHPNVSNLDLGSDITSCTLTSIILNAATGFNTYLWSTLETTSSITVTQSGTYSLTVTDACGNIAFDEIEVLLDNNCIWPGDFNYDGIVNNQDVVAYGLIFGESGFPRSNATLNWEAQPCPDWTGTQMNGVNYKHVDCDGNGIIDFSDFQCIWVNYGQTHTLPPVASVVPGNPLQLSAVVTQPAGIVAGNPLLFIDLMLEDESGAEVTDYGNHFSINYFLPPAMGTIENMWVDFHDSWLGTKDVDMVAHAEIIAAENRIEIGMSRINHQNKTGSGKIGQLIIEVEVDDVNTIDSLQMFIDMSGIELVMSNGITIPVGGQNQTLNINVAPPVTAQISTLLEGAYTSGTGLMSTNLKDSDLLPLTQPFNQSPWNYAGTESVTNLNDIPANTVDWVLVEARSVSDNNVVASQRAAFLLNDGSIIDIDGVTNGVNLYGLTEGTDYHLVVRHRNHLAVMSATPITLPNATPYDFSSSGSQAMGNNQMIEVTPSVFALYAGDFDSNGTVTVADFNFYQTQASMINGYLDSDCNLDKNVTIADFNLYQPNSSIIGISPIRY